MKIQIIVALLLSLAGYVSAQEKIIKPVLKSSLEREKFAKFWFNPNGRHILVIEQEVGLNLKLNNDFKGEVEFIEARTGKTVSRFRVCGGLNFAEGSFSFDTNLWAVICQSGKAEVWDIEQSKLVQDFYPIKGNQVISLVLSTDGTRLLTFENFDKFIAATDDRVVLWNVQTGKAINELYPNLTASKDANKQAEFSDDSEMVAVSYLFDVYLWNARNGRQIARLVDKSLGSFGAATHRHLAYTMRFSPDESKLVTGSVDRTYKIWDTLTGELLKTLEGHKSRDGNAFFSVDGELLVTSDWAKTIKLWRVKSGELLWTTKLKNSTYHLTFSPNGQKLFLYTHLDSMILDVKTGRTIWSEKGRG